MRFDASLGGIKVPRFLLQPLVENAVRHGIAPKESNTRILVSVQRRGDKIKAFIIDTGLGIAKDELVRLRRVIGSSSAEEPAREGLLAGSGIGLANVATRLWILYGREGSLQLFSKAGKGTIVRLSIPMKGVSRWPES